MQCHTKKAAPCEMSRGSATTDGKFAYFTPDDSNLIFRYEWSSEEWKPLPPSPYVNSGLVIINGELTAVGGEDGSYCRTNKLFTLHQDEWVDHFSPMNTARSSPAVVSTSVGNYIFVIGGWVGVSRWTATVELFHVTSRRWYELTNLPQSLIRPSATICGNELHVIGRNSAGYSCSLQALLSSDQSIISNILTWIPLPQQPVECSTVAYLCGQLVIVGCQRGLNSIHQLIDGQWIKIGSMRCVRSECLVFSPLPDKLMIVGGLRGFQALDIVEECVVV